MIINTKLTIITGEASEPVLHALGHLKRDLSESLGTVQFWTLGTESVAHLNLFSSGLMHAKQARLLRLLLWLSLC